MSRPRILVVEDNAADVELLRLALDRQKEDYYLQVIEDGEHALRFISEYSAGDPSHDPCLILLDVNLPKHDGMEVLRALERNPALNGIQVLVLSSVASAQTKAEIRSRGAVYRTKPVSLQEFMELGAEIFGLCKQGALA